MKTFFKLVFTFKNLYTLHFISSFGVSKEMRGDVGRETAGKPKTKRKAVASENVADTGQLGLTARESVSVEKSLKSN